MMAFKMSSSFKNGIIFGIQPLDFWSVNESPFFVGLPPDPKKDKPKVSHFSTIASSTRGHIPSCIQKICDLHYSKIVTLPLEGESRIQNLNPNHIMGKKRLA